MNAMRIALIHGNDGTDVRVSKTCRSLSRMGYRVHFIGWDRRPGETKRADLGRTARHVMEHATPHGRLTARGQWRFWRHMVGALRRIRPHTVCCVNEDCALLALPFRGVLYRRLVCDVFDALADRHSRRALPVRWALRAVGELVRGSADRLIATDRARLERFGRFRGKCVVVENVPEDPGAALAEALPTGSGKIYVGGSLSESRGLRQVIEAVEPLDDVEIVAAGWAYDRYAAETFIPHPKVTFRGVVTGGESLALAASCDAVLAFYAPVSVNNIEASPNKIHDALSVGRRVIVNREIRVARRVEAEALGWTCGYDDVAALRRIAASLVARRSSLPAFTVRARRAFLRGGTWADMEPRLREVYG